MADDIVKELRDVVCWCADFDGVCHACQAAAEIERLQAAGDALAEALHGWCNGMDAFTDDAERLRAWQEARRG